MSWVWDALGMVPRSWLLGSRGHGKISAFEGSGNQAWWDHAWRMLWPLALGKPRQHQQSCLPFAKLCPAGGSVRSCLFQKVL